MIRFNEACGNAGKVVAARLLPDTDLIEGIEEICKSNQIKYAYVSCFGSFKKCGYMYLVPKSTAKVKAGYGDIITKEGPIEFLNGTVFGGHIVKGHTPTLTTVDLIIMEIKDVEMLRVYDEETDLTQFLPQK